VNFRKKKKKKKKKKNLSILKFWKDDPRCYYIFTLVLTICASEKLFALTIKTCTDSEREREKLFAFNQSKRRKTHGLFLCLDFGRIQIDFGRIQRKKAAQQV
jgi:hypothetical protein